MSSVLPHMGQVMLLAISTWLFPAFRRLCFIA
jgi:hypothetical protein